MKDYKSRALKQKDPVIELLTYWTIVITIMSCSFAGWWLGL